ncbi:hypothetical protein A946_00055 [Methylacidiphilum kamchatkense Kam1]|uniref:Uncharacterized protein n=1 Tax=Methylacidiphilum kamchatkense Kam1 TaxID=1202785 RepID=A0A0C1UTS8_9BACT|nr:hypothetical protein [Methylacidiphilum kamchatkense]KIE59173.1 hypothetical protein A946_00055 [Methylacidiphilum kamchatkense Kam1]QDQ42878.1 hypothetical protein kam1_1663 [Methylacidiphilum kamchatkense Kam1]
MKLCEEEGQRIMLLGAYFSFIGGIFQGIANFNIVSMANLLYLLTMGLTVCNKDLLTRKAKH